MSGLQRPQLALLAAYALAAAPAAWAGFDFGVKLGGAPMGALMGVNCAVFAWLMVGAAADAIERVASRRRQARH